MQTWGEGVFRNKSEGGGLDCNTIRILRALVGAAAYEPALPKNRKSGESSNSKSDVP